LSVGSPVIAEKQELEDIGRQLKKNSISIDIISFGEPNAQQNEEKLQTLLAAANNADENGKDNSHFVPIPTGNMSDILGQMTGDQAGGASAAMELDPELAWAMELSKQTFEQETKQTTGTSETKPDSTDVEMKDTEEVTATPSATTTSPQASFLPDLVTMTMILSFWRPLGSHFKQGRSLEHQHLPPHLSLLRKIQNSSRPSDFHRPQPPKINSATSTRRMSQKKNPKKSNLPKKRKNQKKMTWSLT